MNQLSQANQLLSELELATKNMLDHLNEGELDALQALDEQRQKIIDSYSQLTLSEEEYLDLSSKLHRISELDTSLNNLLKEVYDKIGNQLKEIRHGKRVKKAYQQNHQ